MIEELESASQIVLAPPNRVTPAERQAAENVFLAFRKSHMPYAMCRTILETCQNDYVLFQAASAIKESIVREWKLLNSSDIETLRSFLLQYVTKHPSLQGYVREQILQAVAVIFKRASLESDVIDKEALFNDVTQLIATGDLSLQLIACSILTALLNEFSSTSKSSSVGLTWEFHSKCKIHFEQKDLQCVFGFCLQVLHELDRSPTETLSRELVAVFNRMLAITEQVLGWTFVPKHIPKRIIGSFLTNQAISFRPPGSWRDMVLNRDLLHLLFKIHQKVRFNSEMAHHSLQCLAQLATLNGPVFQDDKVKVAYLSSFIAAILEICSHCKLQDYEALGFATMLNNLVSFFPVSLFMLLEKNVLESFLTKLAEISCHFGQAAALEETMHKEDALYQEAYEKLLDSWIVFLTDLTSFPQDSVKPHAVQIFNAYLGCHLAPPDGMRNQNTDGSLVEEDEEYDEIEEDDRDRFTDQLKSVGVLGRLTVDHAVSVLGRLLEDRVSRLHGQLQRMSQHQQQCRSKPGGMDMTVVNSINEDLHWILLISSHVLSDVTEGETPMIPAEILKLCQGQTDKINLDTTLKVLSSPGNKIQDIPGAEQFTDPVVRLVSAVFRLCEVENRAIAGNLSSCLSPQVATSAMWFLKNWVVSYLLPNENYYTELSSSLTASFGHDSEGGMWTIGFLLDKIMCNLGAWQSEVKLLKDTLELFISMVDKLERAKFVTKCPMFWKLAQANGANQHPCKNLPPSARRLLSRALVLAGSSSFDDMATKNEYWSSVLESVHTRFTKVLHHPEMKTRYQEEEIRQEVLTLLETVCGAVEATQSANAKLILQFVYPVLGESAALLELYHDSEDLVILILQLFNEIVSRLLGYLDHNDSEKIYQCCLAVMQTYTKFNIGRKLNRKDEEEDQFSDISLLIEILTNLLSKDIMDFLDTNSGDHISVVDVVLHGLNIVVPLMNAELLKFPTLCTLYMRLLTYLAEMYPEKVCVLPEDLLKSLLAAVEYGIGTLGSDVVKLSLEFVSFTAEHLSVKKVQGTYMCEAMGHFLKVVFHMLVLDSFDMDLFDTASHCFFSLICCHQERYRDIVTELLQQQPEHYDRLVDAFNKLTPPGLALCPSRLNRIQFTQNFDAFLSNVRGFLCIR